MKKKALEIPKIVYTDQFLRFIATYTKDFKNNNGYGKWLAEYKRMENLGMFEPEKLRELFIEILDGTSTLSYIYWDAVHFICTRALDAAKAFSLANSFEIRIITGEIAYNDDGEKLKDLSMEEALSICKAMNAEAGELLFVIYNSNTNKIVK